MAFNDDVIEVLLKIATDKSSVTGALRDVNSVKSALKDLGNANVNNLQSQISNTTKEFSKLRAEIKATADEASNIGSGAGGDAGADIAKRGSALRLAGSQLRQLPAIQLAGGVSSDSVANIVRVSGAIGELTEAAGLSTPVLAAATIALAAAGAVILYLTQQSEGLTNTVKGLIASQKEYFELVNKGSREDLANAIKTKQDALTVAKSQRDELVKLQADAFNDLTTQFGGDLGARIGEQAARSFNVAGINDQDKAITDLNKTIAEQEFALGRLTGAQQTNITATNDLTKAHEAQVSVFIKSAKDAADEQAKLAGLMRTASSSQVEALVATNKERIDALTAEAKTLQSVAATSQEARDRLFAIQTEVNNLTGETTKLQGAILGAAKAREAEKKATDDQLKASNELTKIRDEAASDEQKRADDVKAITEKTEAAQSKLASAYKLANDEAKNAAQQEDAKTKRGRADADLETAIEREAKKAEIDTAAAAQEVERRQKLAETLKKIGEEFAFDEAGAVQNRDAVALAAAIDKRNKATSEAQTTAEKEKEQIAKDRQDRFKQLQKEFAAQDAETKRHRASEDRETQIARANETRARRDKFYRDQADLQAAERAEILARQQTYIKQIGDLASFLKTQELNNAGYFGTILTKAKDFQKQLEGILNGSSSSSTSSSSSSADKAPRPGRSVPTKFAGGGYTARGGLALLHPGELVLTSQQQKQMGGGFTFAPTLNATNATDIRTQVDAQLDKFLKAAGVT